MRKSREDANNHEMAKAYLEGQGDAADREAWEQQLLEDEEVFASYMKMLDELEDELPPLENSTAFTESVIKDWADRLAPSTELEQISDKEGKRRYRWYEKTIFHYAVAASLTLLIMSSGMFDRLLTGEMELVIPKKDNSPSFSEQMMQATSGWLDRLMDGK